MQACIPTANMWLEEPEADTVDRQGPLHLPRWLIDRAEDTRRNREWLWPTIT